MVPLKEFTLGLKDLVSVGQVVDMATTLFHSTLWAKNNPESFHLRDYDITSEYSYFTASKRSLITDQFTTFQKAAK